MAITETTLDRKAERQAKVVRRWLRTIGRRVNDRLDDCLSHATKALTESARAEPDGRATIRRVNRNPSYKAAEARLSALADDLAGPSLDSLEGLLRDARAELLADAFAEWAEMMPEIVLRANRAPTKAETNAARRHAPHGMELRAEVLAKVEDLARRLGAACAQASTRDLGSRQATAILKAWRDRAGRAMLATVQSAVSDAAIFTDTAAGWLIVREEFRDDPDEPPLAV